MAEEDTARREELSKAPSITEIEKYLCFPRMQNLKADPLLDFWIQKKSELPNLFEIACDYLTIPATSASSERVFSRASYACLKRRNRLSADNLEKTVMLQFNDNM